MAPALAPSRDHAPEPARVSAGRVARKRRSRESLDTWKPTADRLDPLDLLASQERPRVGALLPLRHTRMGVSPFTFYRGSALVMAADLGTLPTTELDVQLCGDAHLGNFGVYAAPDRRLVFDVNDYDETAAGPFEWDVLRLSTSFVLAGAEGKAGKRSGERAAQIAADAYAQRMRSSATATEVSNWYARDDEDALLAWAGAAPSSRQMRMAVVASTRGALSETVESAVERYTEAAGPRGRSRRFREEAPGLIRIGPDSPIGDWVRGSIEGYQSGLGAERAKLLRRYEIVDVGHKIVGVGSVGLFAFLVLLHGSTPTDYLLLQVKQAVPSVLTDYLPRLPKSARGGTHADRVVAGMRFAQPDPDLFLGAADRGGGASSYVRQFRDLKWAPDTSTMSASMLEDYAALCGHALGRSHARTGDPVAIAAYIGSSDAFATAVAGFASRYAEQVKSDWQAYAAALRDGRLTGGEKVSKAALIRGLRAAAEG